MIRSQQRFKVASTNREGHYNSKELHPPAAVWMADESSEDPKPCPQKHLKSKYDEAVVLCAWGHQME